MYENNVLMHRAPDTGFLADHGKGRSAACVRALNVRAADGAMAGCLLRAVVRAALLLAAASPALAASDSEVCVVAQQLAAAAEKDVGVWIDRVTRNGGMVVACDRRTVEYRRFSYAPSSAMTDAWKAGKAADWSATHCSSVVWKEAIAAGWKVVLSQTAADGGHVTFTAQCGG